MIKWYEERPHTRQRVALYKQGITPQLLHEIAVWNNLEDDIYPLDIRGFQYPDHLSRARECSLNDKLKKWFLNYASRTPERLLDLSLFLFSRYPFFIPLFENAIDFLETRCSTLGIEFTKGTNSIETYFNLCDAVDGFRYRHYLDPEDVIYILYDIDEDETLEF